MDLPKKTIGIRLPGEEEGGKRRKKRAKPRREARKQGAGEAARKTD